MGSDDAVTPTPPNVDIESRNLRRIGKWNGTNHEQRLLFVNQI